MQNDMTDTGTDAREKLRDAASGRNDFPGRLFRTRNQENREAEFENRGIQAGKTMKSASGNPVEKRPYHSRRCLREDSPDTDFMTAPFLSRKL